MSKTINLLADDEIAKWWDDPDNKSDRQERLRQAVKIGLAVLSGKLATVDAKDKEMTEALQKLIQSGLVMVAKGSVDLSVLEQPTQRKEPSRPDLGLLKKVRPNTV